jgi:hypothetical protein
MWQLVFSFSNPLTTYVSFGSEIYALTAIYEFHTSVLGAEKLVLLPYIYIYIIKKIVFIWDAKQRLLGPYLLLWVRFFCFHQINTGVFYACYWWFQFHAWSSISEDISKCEINTSVLRWNMGWCYLIIFNIHSTAFSTIWNMWPSR